MHALLKAAKEYEDKSSDFDCTHILEKVKMIVSRLDAKVNLTVFLCDAISNFMLIKQQSCKTNDG